MEKIITNIEDPLTLAALAIRKINELVEEINKIQREIEGLKKGNTK